MASKFKSSSFGNPVYATVVINAVASIIIIVKFVGFGVVLEFVTAVEFGKEGQVDRLLRPGTLREYAFICSIIKWYFVAKLQCFREGTVIIWL